MYAAKTVNRGYSRYYSLNPNSNLVAAGRLSIDHAQHCGKRWLTV